MTPTIPPLFVYGTLRYPPLLAAVFGRPLPPAALRPAAAPGFRAVPYPGGRLYPALVQAPRRAAEGLLVAGLGTAELDILDAFEGAEYRRGAIRVVADGTDVAAAAYWPTAAVPADAPDWDFALWRANHSATVVVEDGAAAAAIRRRLAAAAEGGTA